MGKTYVMLAPVLGVWYEPQAPVPCGHRRDVCQLDQLPRHRLLEHHPQVAATIDHPNKGFLHPLHGLRYGAFPVVQSPYTYYDPIPLRLCVYRPFTMFL
jgi:hypothetical protein